MDATQRMKCKRVCIALLGVMIGLVSPAQAQDETRKETKGPNRTMIRTGIAALGVAYVPSFIVASTNPRPDDDYLFIPVVGPWLDLAHRQPCVDCSHEPVNKALLVTSGVFQGVGTLEIVGSFLFMETTVRSTEAGKREAVASAPHMPLTIVPTPMNGGYGISASGEF